MAGPLFEGDFVGKAVTAEVGLKKGKPIIRIEMEITEGDLKGRRVSYEGQFGEKNVKFTKRAMLAVGWKGKTVSTFVEDVKTANLTVPFKVEIATWTRDDGSVSQWSAVRSIGSGGTPLEPVDSDKLRSMDSWLEQAGDVGGSTAGDDSLPF